MKRVRFIRDDIQTFLLSFDDSIVAKIISALELLDELGKQIRPPRSKKVAKDVFELRVLANLSVRIFYSFYKENIWILHAFVKKSQRIPTKELKIVINRLRHLQ
ncbi:MAG: type II toxin-antitoxin system RelE/ParE family toxin [Patescibacteria group bacterium]